MKMNDFNDDYEFVLTMNFNDFNDYS